jgi:hypothetical protein
MRKALVLIGFVAASCGGPPRYDGTYQGPATAVLTPAPQPYGSPSYTVTVGINEGVKSTAVQGWITGYGCYAANPIAMTGTFSSDIDKKNALPTVTINIDQLFNACGQAMTLTGTGSLVQDPSSGIFNLVWTAEGDTHCGGLSPHVVMSSGDAGMPRITTDVPDAGPPPPVDAGCTP